MPVNISRVEGLIEFLRFKLSQYEEVPNISLIKALAVAEGYAYKVVVRKNFDHITEMLFHPNKGSGGEFTVTESSVGGISNVFDQADVDLRNYEEVPDFLRSLIDEFTEKNPDFTLNILLAP